MTELQGKRRAVVLAVSIICDAIDRYKELCEGAFCGAATVCLSWLPKQHGHHNQVLLMLGVPVCPCNYQPKLSKTAAFS